MMYWFNHLFMRFLLGRAKQNDKRRTVTVIHKHSEILFLSLVWVFDARASNTRECGFSDVHDVIPKGVFLQMNEKTKTW